ncbi:MAG: glycosyltransferase family 1 protein [Planctomycetes bacterium]|nr:glycosyltransferase family 1 protein [Planctomycetota bacterium]
MNVFVFNPDHPMARGDMSRGSGYCGLTACVLEGLQQLGHRVTSWHVGINAPDAGPFRADFDLYLVQRSNLFSQTQVLRLLERDGCLPRTAFLDGHDWAFGPEFHWLHTPATYFKKENFGDFPVHTLPFGISDAVLPERYGADGTARGGARVMFALRYETHRDQRRIISSLQETGIECLTGRIEDPTERRDVRYWLTGGRYNRTYYDALRGCRVGLAAEGAAVDTLRYWEFAASFVALVAPRVETVIRDFPDPPSPGKHYVAYDGVESVVPAVRQALERCEEIVPQQREFFLAHHRCRHRALRLLSIMGMA